VAKALTLGVALLGLTALSQAASAHCPCGHTAYHSSWRHHYYARDYRPYYRESHRTTYEPYYRARYRTTYEPYWSDSYYYRPYYGSYWSEPNYAIGFGFGPSWNGGYYGGDWDEDDDD
jgi:hypothetical protein